MSRLRMSGLIFTSLALITALLWFLRESGSLSFQRPENLAVPAVALSVMGFVLLGIDRRKSAATPKK